MATEHPNFTDPDQEKLAEIEKLRERGVLFDELLLLKPDLAHPEKVREKIHESLQEAKQGIDDLRAQGKHVLYLPGSYDLVHIGHAYHVEQSIVQYLAQPENKHLTEKDVAAVVLADDDDLIRSIKGPQRPVQAGDQRLQDLASIPMVDLVGFLPSPLRVKELAISEMLTAQQNPDFIATGLTVLEAESALSIKDSSQLRVAIDQYRHLLDRMRTDPTTVGEVSVQAWQLFIHAYLGAGEFLVPMVRMVHRDSDYAPQVVFLMQAAGIQTALIHEESLATTSGLLKQYGPDVLLQRKRQYARG